MVYTMTTQTTPQVENALIIAAAIATCYPGEVLDLEPIPATTDDTPKTPPPSKAPGLSYPLDGYRHHKLMDAASVRSLPPLYWQESRGDAAIAHVKLFSPYSGHRWYLTEYDPDEHIAFGLVTTPQGDPELGYVSLDELGEAARGRLPLVERDLHYKPLTIAAIRAGAY